MIFYVINGHVTGNKIDNKSHSAYLMENAATTRFILYWNPYHHFISTQIIMPVFVHIIIIYTNKTITLPVIYSINKILKVCFIIHICLTWFHVNLILYPLHFVIQKLPHMRLSYPILKIYLVLTYFMVNILQYLMSLIQSKIHQPSIKFQHRVSKFCWS